MQTFGLHGHVTRGAALASRLCGAKTQCRPPLARRPASRVERRRHGRRLARDAVRLGRGTGPGPRRPRRVRRRQWTPTPVAAVQRMRRDCPMWGKARIAVLRAGHAVSESTTGCILKMLMERGAGAPVPTRNEPCVASGHTLAKGRKPTSPGEIVQLDTLLPHPGRSARFTVHDPVAKWTCAQA